MLKKTIFFLFIFLFSCTSNVKFYEKTGFANLSKNQQVLSVLPKGTLIKITNLENKATKIIKTDDVEKKLGSRIILLTENIYKELKLNKNLPLVNIQSIRSNKTFVAKKTKIFEEEKKVKNKVKIEKVQISSLNIEKKLNNKIYLSFGPFYFKSFAEGLYKIIYLNLNNKQIISKDYKDKNHTIQIGPLKNIIEYDKMYLNLSKIGLINFNIIIQ